MSPSPLVLPSTTQDSRSLYSMATVHEDDARPSSVHSSLLAETVTDSAYGATSPTSPSRPSSRKLLFHAAFKMTAIFILSTAFLGGTLWLALPTLEEEDRPSLKIPTSFAQLQVLNTLLKKYRDIYPYRIVICYVTTYLFLQAFSLPGSMYLSILGGAMWGVPRALPLACTCVATGATLCYFISAALGPALLTLPKWKARLDVWASQLDAQKDNLISFLIVLRISPFPPHWVVNVLCPHLGIGVVPFWATTWLGIFGVTVIHTTIGGSLDDMTSAADFHLISWKNFFLLSAVVAGALIPVGLRYYFKKELANVASAEADVEVDEGALLGDEADLVIAEGPRAVTKKDKQPQLILLSDEETEEYSDEDSDEDVILEAGPALVFQTSQKTELGREGSDSNSSDALDRRNAESAHGSENLLL